jgi:hypothetical protein
MKPIYQEILGTPFVHSEYCLGNDSLFGDSHRDPVKSIDRMKSDILSFKYSIIMIVRSTINYVNFE